MQLLMIAALVCFVLVALELKVRGVNLTGAGLALYVLAALAGAPLPDLAISALAVWLIVAVVVLVVLIRRTATAKPKP